MPTTTGRATDFITFTRTSNATVTDSNGFIKWAGHNLLTNSESFDASAWVKGGSATVSANTTVAPNGTTTADKVVSANNTGEQRVYRNTAVPSDVGIRYTFSVFAKADGANWLVLRDDWSGFSDTSFDLVNGVVGTVASGRTATISAVGSGFYLCTISNTVTASYVVGSISLCLADADNGRATFVGNGTKALILWGAHLYRSDLGGMVLNPARGDAYYPTTPRNLLGFTEDWTNAAWGVEGASPAANVANAINGLMTADQVTETAVTSAHAISQTLTLIAGRYTYSVYLKKGTGATAPDWIQLTFGGNAFDWANFNLTNSGSVGNSSSVGIATITSVGDGWYRCSLAMSPTAGNSSVQIVFTNNTNAASRRPSYAGATTSDVLVWGAQLSDSASLDTYSPVYGAAVTSAAYYAPRLDYDPVTLAARGLLVEELRTNLLQHTAAFDNAYWSKNKLNTTGTPAWVNVGVAPDGTLSAEKLIPNTTSAADHNILSTNVSSGNYTMSIYAKADGYSKLMLYDNGTSTGYGFDLSAGTTFAVSGISAASSPLIVPVGNGWYRCSIYATGGLRFDVYVLNDTSFSAYSGNGTDGVLVWGAQIETGSFATSYIPNGSAVAGATRAADVASVSTQAFPYSASEGTVIVNAAFLTAQTSGNRFVWQLRNDGSNRIAATGSPNSALFRHLSFVGGTAVGIVDYNVTQTFKDAFAYKADDYAGSTAGAAVVADTTGAVPPAAVDLNLGNNANASDFLNGYIRQITYLPRRLSNAELQSRSA